VSALGGDRAGRQAAERAAGQFGDASFSRPWQDRGESNAGSALGRLPSGPGRSVGCSEFVSLRDVHFRSEPKLRE
jgi:hypothetical protein